MLHPDTRYARSGPVSIAYQVVGEGTIDLVLVPGFVSHVEVAWEEPRLARFLTRLGSFSRMHPPSCTAESGPRRRRRLPADRRVLVLRPGHGQLGPAETADFAAFLADM